MTADSEEKDNRHKLRTGKAGTRGHPTFYPWGEQTKVHLSRVGTEGCVGPKAKGFFPWLLEL